MKVITRVMKPINKHNPKAQSVYVPKEKVTYNQFQEHIRKELCRKTL